MLALPMLHRGMLIGFVLLGEKPDHSVYRPDEIEALEPRYASGRPRFPRRLKIPISSRREGAKLSEQLHRLELENAFYRDRSPQLRGIAE